MSYTNDPLGVGIIVGTFLMVAAVLAFSLFGFSSCTATGEFSPQNLATELDLVSADLTDLADVVEGKNPEEAARLRLMAGYVDKVDVALHAYIAGETESGELFATIDAVLALSDALMEPDDPSRIYISVARSALRRAGKYIDAG